MLIISLLIHIFACFVGSYLGNWLYYKFEHDDVIYLGDDDDVSNH